MIAVAGGRQGFHVWSVRVRGFGKRSHTQRLRIDVGACYGSQLRELKALLVNSEPVKLPESHLENSSSLLLNFQ